MWKNKKKIDQNWPKMGSKNFFSLTFEKKNFFQIVEQRKIHFLKKKSAEKVKEKIFLKIKQKKIKI